MCFWPMLRKLPGEFAAQFIYISVETNKSCQLRQPGYTCRDAFNECDLPEMCTGESGQCPPDVYVKNGSPCGVSRQTVNHWMNC